MLDWRTGAASQVTRHGYNAEPSFSPDGRWIVFRSDLSHYGYLNIWAVRVDGTGLHRLTKGNGELAAESPSFSTNGRWVAFTAEPLSRGRREIDRVAFRGGHRQVLVPSGPRKYALSPTYSPDGRHLAWVQGMEAPRAEPHIYIGDTLGRHERRVAYGVDPAFSPDGRNIVFVRSWWCAKGVLGSEIDSLSLETGQLSIIKKSCGVLLGGPTYSPDGSWIVYTIGFGEKSELGFTPAPLFFDTAPPFAPLAGLGTDLPVDESPSWQPVP